MGGKVYCIPGTSYSLYTGMFLVAFLGRGRGVGVEPADLRKIFHVRTYLYFIRDLERGIRDEDFITTAVPPTHSTQLDLLG